MSTNLDNRLNIGFIPVAAQFFLQGNMFKKGSPSHKLVEESIQSIIDLIGKYHNVITSGLVTTLDQSNQLKEKFKEEKIDLIIACNIMWSEDQLILNIIREFKNTPLAVWCYSPFKEIKNGITMDDFVRATGPCGTYQSLPALFRLEKKIKFIVGEPGEETTQRKLNDFLDANLVIKNLRKTRIGLIPSRWDVQTDTMIDEAYLTDVIGPEVIHFSYSMVRKFFDRINDKEINKYFNEIKKKYKIEKVTDNVLKIAVRASLAFRDFSRVNEIDAISYNENDPDLYEIIGLNPCIYFDDLYQQVEVFGMEGDLPSITSMLILRNLTDKGIMFSEILTTDRVNNFFLSGHPGNHNLKNLVEKDEDVIIMPDYEWKDSELNVYGYEGAWMFFIAKKGDITLNQLIYHRGKIKMIYCRAKSLGIKIMDYYPQATIGFPFSMDDFLYRAGNIGCGHHWTFAFGDLRNKLKNVAGLLGIDSVDIELTKE